MITRRIIVLALLLGCSVATAPPAAAAGDWAWPIVGPILRVYDPPDSPYGSGHRGIDIGAPAGTSIRAPEAGKVTFAGKVGGQLFVTIDHGRGVSSTYSWLMSIAVKKGDVIARGAVIARSGSGHPGDTQPSLHMGVKLNGNYADPMDYLGPLDISGLIRLAPLDAPARTSIFTPWRPSPGYPAWFP